MKPFYFSKLSLSKLDTCHPDLNIVMRVALHCSSVDFGISEGHRSVERQQELYAKGRTAPGPIVTYVDGVKKKGKHNEFPSLAVDIYAWVDGKVSYDIKHLTYIAGIVQAVSVMLKGMGIISSEIVWGGNWDKDGTIITDQKFLDGPHFEIWNG